MQKSLPRLLIILVVAATTAGCASWQPTHATLAQDRVCRPGSAVPQPDPMAANYPSYKRWTGGSCARY